MKKSTVFMITALLLIACLLSAGCLSFPGLGSASSGTTQGTKTPTKTPGPTPSKVPTTTVKPTTPQKVPCKNCISSRNDDIPVFFQEAFFPPQISAPVS
jgi:hypothetical protein